MNRSQEEFRLACFVADTLRRFAFPEIVWSHFPAGENRTAITGARLQRMGLARGWPDYIFITAGAHAAFLELKSKGGRLSPEQRAFKSAVEALGCRYAVADSGQAAVEILQSWGILSHRVRAAA